MTLVVAPVACRKDAAPSVPETTCANDGRPRKDEGGQKRKEPSFVELRAATERFLAPGAERDSLALHRLFEQARAADVAAVLDSLELDDPENREILAAAFLALGKKDAALYLKYASRLDPTSFLLSGAFLTPLLPTDRKAVIDWLVHGPHETAAARALQAEIRTHLSRADPGALIPLLDEVEDKWQRVELMSRAYQSWGEQDLLSAFAYARSTAGDDLNRALADILRGAAKGQQQEALEFLRGQSPAFPADL